MIDEHGWRKSGGNTWLMLRGVLVHISPDNVLTVQVERDGGLQETVTAKVESWEHKTAPPPTWAELYDRIPKRLDASRSAG